MPQVIVINLDSAQERWGHIKRQLDSVGVTPERFSAIDGRAINHPLFEMYDEEYRVRRKGTPLSLGQLGCFASHYLVWQRCVELGEPVIVLEDDVTLIESCFREFLQQAPRLGEDIECVRLFRNRVKHCKSISMFELGALSFVKYTKGPMSGMGYYLTPAGAKKFLAGADKWFLAVDMYMDRFWSNKVECIGVSPECITHEHLFDSIIGYDRNKKPRSLAVRFRRELFSLAEISRRFFHNLRFMCTHKCARWNKKESLTDA